MDRPITYPAQIPLDTDLLRTGRYARTALGRASERTFAIGTTVAAGLALSLAGGLSVSIAPGSILAPSVEDATAVGSLPASQTPLPVAFILSAAVTLTLPTTTGPFYIYASYATVDTDNVVLPFYNAANPSQTYSGQNNDGASLPQTRSDQLTVAVGTTVPANAVSLYTITVPSGTTDLTTDMVALSSAAPFFPTIPQMSTQVIAPFNARLAGLVGGYAMGAMVPNVSTPGRFYISITDGNKVDPAVDPTNWVDPLSSYATSVDLAAEVTRAKAAEAALSTALAQEVTARQAADSTLQDNITTATTTWSQNLTAEAQQRSGADSDLATSVSAERTAREQADTQLQTAIAAEVTARTQADTQLTNSKVNRAGDTMNGDLTVQGTVLSENTTVGQAAAVYVTANGVVALESRTTGSSPATLSSLSLGKDGTLATSKGTVALVGDLLMAPGNLQQAFTVTLTSSSQAVSFPTSFSGQPTVILCNATSGDLDISADNWTSSGFTAKSYPGTLPMVASILAVGPTS